MYRSVSWFRMNLDKHRESLVKYCYDISMVAFGISVLNPAIGLSRSLAEIVIGLVLAALFLGLALHLERGSPP